jgi:hypothetical protein
MKTLSLCILAALAISVSASNANLPQEILLGESIFTTIKDMALDALGVVTNVIAIGVSAVTKYVVAPILTVVDTVSQIVIAPITDGASYLALILAVKTLCGTVHGKSTNEVQARCQAGGIEEVFKAFSKKWDANNAAGNLALVEKAMT